MSPRRSPAALRRSASALCGVATALVVVVGVLFGRELLDEGLPVAGYLLGAPLLAAVVALASATTASAGRAAVVVSITGAASLGWAIVTVVGLGLYLLVPALLLCTAAVLLVVAAVEGARARRTSPGDGAERADRSA